MIEMLLSIAIISLITGIGTPVYQSFQNRNELDVAAVTFAQSLRRAQVLARSSDGDTSWGVAVLSSSITLFKGASYASRDTDYDELSTMSDGITITGTSEYVFDKFTGLPTTTGTLTLTSVNNETRDITINDKGTISY